MPEKRTIRHLSSPTLLPPLPRSFEGLEPLPMVFCCRAIWATFLTGILFVLLFCAPLASGYAFASTSAFSDGFSDGKGYALKGYALPVVRSLAQKQDDHGVSKEKASPRERGRGQLFSSWKNFSFLGALRSTRQSLARALWLWQTPSDTVSGDYLALGYAEAEKAFPNASSIADRLATRLPTREVWERAFLAHVRAGEMEKALGVAGRLQDQKDGHGFLARFLLASDALKDGEASRAREFVGDLSGFGDFARYGAATYRFWLSFAQGDTRGERSALQEMERESREDFALLLRVYASFARGKFRMTRQLLREAGSSSDDLSLLWIRALHHAHSEEDRGKQTALALLSPVKNQLRVQVLFLDEMARHIESGEIKQLLPDVSGERWDDWAVFFLARSLADLAMREGNAAAKLLFARLATETDPSSSFARLVLSDALFDHRQDDAALAVAEKIPSHALFYRQALYLRAEILRRQERLDEALALLKTLQEIRPDDMLAWWYAGSFQRVAEKPAESLSYLDKGIALYLARAESLSQEVRSSGWRLYYERGIAFEREGRWDDAERDFLTALQLSPEQPMVLNYLAYTWLDMEKDEHYEEALSMLQRAVQLRANSGAVTDSLGWAYYRLKEYDDALETLEQAVAMTPEDPTINDHLGDVYWRVGRLLEARYQWMRALVFETEDKEMRARVQKKLETGLPVDID